MPSTQPTLASREGKYWGTEKYIFSDRYAGYLDGNSTVNYGVTSGERPALGGLGAAPAADETCLTLCMCELA